MIYNFFIISHNYKGIFTRYTYINQVKTLNDY